MSDGAGPIHVESLHASPDEEGMRLVRFTMGPWVRVEHMISLAQYNYFHEQAKTLLRQLLSASTSLRVHREDVAEFRAGVLTFVIGVEQPQQKHLQN